MCPETRSVAENGRGCMRDGKKYSYTLVTAAAHAIRRAVDSASLAASSRRVFRLAIR